MVRIWKTKLTKVEVAQPQTTNCEEQMLDAWRLAIEEMPVT